MFEALSFLRHFDEPALDWLFDHAVERQVMSGTILIEEGRHPEAVFIVVQGLVGVRVASAGERPVAQLGPGELLGEISLLEDSPATATVTATENTLLLTISRDVLRDRLDANAQFAAQWYRAVALIQSRRLRERVTALTERARSVEELAEHAEAALQPTLAAVNEFKSLLRELDQHAIKHGRFDEDLRRSTCAKFQEFLARLNEQIGDASLLPDHVRQKIGARISIELLPYVLLTSTTERFYSKPRGYAGDYMTIELIYQNRPGGSQRVGPLLDHWFLENSAAKAVRNRRGLFAREIRRTCEAAHDRPARVCALACGPAEEVFDVLTAPEGAPRIEATLVDIDAQALDFVRSKAATLGFDAKLRFVEGSVIYLAAGRQHIDDLPPQDLIYSIGLIDYFNDKWVVKLLDYIHRLLRPGGRVILGNFHPANPNKVFMDYVLDWKLIHRDEDDMHRLFGASRFGRSCTDIWFEDERINLFAECVKAPNVS